MYVVAIRLSNACKTSAPSYRKDSIIRGVLRFGREAANQIENTILEIRRRFQF